MLEFARRERKEEDTFLVVCKEEQKKNCVCDKQEEQRSYLKVLESHDFPLLLNGFQLHGCQIEDHIFSHLGAEETILCKAFTELEKELGGDRMT